MDAIEKVGQSKAMGRDRTERWTIVALAIVTAGMIGLMVWGWVG